MPPSPPPSPLRPRRVIVALVTLPLLAAPAGSSCVGLGHPVPAPIVRGFAPAGAYAGHWGVDYQVAVGTGVRAAGDGTVTFAGVVAGNSTVTIDHGGGLKTSYSYLAERAVGRGQWVRRGATIGRSGIHGELELLHVSVRVDGGYVDPAGYLGCHAAPPGPALRLVPPPS